MLIRSYTDADLTALRSMHAAQGFAYDFPDLNDPRFVLRAVVEDDGRPRMAALLRLTAEAYLLADPAEGKPRQRWQWLLHARAVSHPLCETAIRAFGAKEVAADLRPFSYASALELFLSRFSLATWKEHTHGTRSTAANNVSHQPATRFSNAMNQQLYGQNTSLENTVASGYQNLLNNPGYTQAQQTAITGQSMGALASTFASLANSAANQAARTNNAAGYSDLLDSLARTQGQQAANVAQQNQLSFANYAQQNTLAALQGLSGLYGTNSNLLGRAIGVPSSLLNVDANVAKSPGTGSFLTSLGLGLGSMLL